MCRTSAPPPLGLHLLQRGDGEVLDPPDPVDAAPLAQGRGPLDPERLGAVSADPVAARGRCAAGAAGDHAIRAPGKTGLARGMIRGRNYYIIERTILSVGSRSRFAGG